MLYKVFNSLKEALGQDYFTSRVSDEIVQNLNPKFELREYQNEALGRFDFYFNGYQKGNFQPSFFFIWRPAVACWFLLDTNQVLVG